jgi:ABC-type multidrug transport system ATPase subunit
MRQRLAVGRAVMRRPDLLLLDEPYAGLDAEAREAVDRLVRETRKEGRTVLLATHDVTRESVVTRTLFMDGGRILGAAPEGAGS